MKRILVKVPSGEAEVVSTFPFFHKLVEEYADYKIDVLVDEAEVHLFDYLPFKIETHGIPDEKKSFLGIHHFAMNLHDVFNIDLYFDLTSDVKSAYLGRHFKPLERIGYDNGLNRYMLSKYYKKKENARMDSAHLNLLESYLDKKFSDLKVVGFEKGQNVENFFKADLSDNYLLLVIDDVIDSPEYMEFWREFLKEFAEQKMVLWCNTSKESLNDLLKEICTENIILAERKGPTYMSSLIVNSKGVISTSPWISTMASYMSVDSFGFVETENEVPYFDHFKVSPIIVEYSSAGLKKIISSDDSKSISKISEFLDYTCEKLKL